ncbi:MAG: leucyl/phenylalanyl-tRNA--protein transferase [Bacteroidota bacterium]
MPVFQLTEELIFPNPLFGRPDGLLAVGGDLSPARLLLAYSLGIFPWYSDEDPILWWSPDPRMVLLPSNLRVTKSMKQVLRNNHFRITFDTDFRSVITSCQQIDRPGQEFGTWITQEMLEAYCQLHEMGYAHSVEVWKDEQLVGGLYGISLGNCFFGESMFAKMSNASKAGFITLVQALENKGFALIDCQTETNHLNSLGAENIPRIEFLRMLKNNLNGNDLKGKWTDFR